MQRNQKNHNFHKQYSLRLVETRITSRWQNPGLKIWKARSYHGYKVSFHTMLISCKGKKKILNETHNAEAKQHLYWVVTINITSKRETEGWYVSLDIILHYLHSILAKNTNMNYQQINPNRVICKIIGQMKLCDSKLYPIM